METRRGSELLTMDTLGNSLEDIIPPKGSYPCRGAQQGFQCSAVLDLPGLCDDCAERLANAEHRRGVELWLRSIPATYRDVRWENLLDLKRHDGEARVSLLERTEPAIAAMRARIEGSKRVVLMGPSTAGKTTVALAFLRAAVEARPATWARFIPTAALAREETPDGGPTPYELARSAELLVLDDLGDELKGAAPGSGLLAQRIGPTADLIVERFDRQGQFVVTTGLDRKAIGALYGDRIYRRIFEGAVVIRLGGAARRSAAA